MEAPKYIQDALANIRSTLHLRWNPKAVLLKTGDYDVTGKATRPTYDPRFEVWDKDPHGREYMVMRVQTPNGDFKYPGEWLVEGIWKLHPEKYDNDVAKLLQAQIDDPETLREIGEKKDSDNLIDAVCDWAKYVATPKSAAGLASRGQRFLST